QELMLGNSQDKASARPHRAEHLTQDSLVLLDVFQDIERPNDVELAVEGQPAGVHPKEAHPRHALRRKTQGGREDVAPGHRKVGKFFSNPGQNVARSAPYFQQAPGLREISSNGPSHQLIATLEPETAFLQLREGLEKTIIKPQLLLSVVKERQV